VQLTLCAGGLRTVCAYCISCGSKDNCAYLLGGGIGGNQPNVRRTLVIGRKMLLVREQCERMGSQGGRRL